MSSVHFFSSRSLCEKKIAHTENDSRFDDTQQLFIDFCKDPISTQSMNELQTQLKWWINDKNRRKILIFMFCCVSKIDFRCFNDAESRCFYVTTKLVILCKTCNKQKCLVCTQHLKQTFIWSVFATTKIIIFCTAILNNTYWSTYAWMINDFQHCTRIVLNKCL